LLTGIYIILKTLCVLEINIKLPQSIVNWRTGCNWTYRKLHAGYHLSVVFYTQNNQKHIFFYFQMFLKF